MNEKKIKLTTIAYCILIYFISLESVRFIQDDKTADGTGGIGSLFAIIILIFFLPIIIIAISFSNKNNKYIYLEIFSLFLYIASFILAICFNLISIAYLLTNLIPIILGFILFSLDNKKSTLK